jgi:hypothetical protein
LVQVLKSTKYCDILKEVKIESEGVVSAIELIKVKELDREEIRFAYYKKDKNGKMNIVPRPLDIESHEFLILLKDAIQNNFFSEEFKKDLKEQLHSNR